MYNYDTEQMYSPIQPLDSAFQFYNTNQNFEQPEALEDYFSLLAESNTILTKSSQYTHSITAPFMLKKVYNPFILAETTISSDFEVPWDQAGLALFITEPAKLCQYTRQYSQESKLPFRPYKWARIALENVQDEIDVATVSAAPGCSVDWSSVPYSNEKERNSQDLPMISARLKLERVGRDLWMWYKPILESENDMTMSNTPTPASVSRSWRRCRVIVDFFDCLTLDQEFWVGCYASRPTSSGGQDDLFVEFEDLDIL